MLTRFGLDVAALDVLSRLRGGNSQFVVDHVKSRPDDKRWLDGLGIGLTLYPTPQTRSFEIGLPYVMAIHDLQHRLQPEFPEVSANGEWEYREYMFRNGARCATLLLADSEVGKEDILNFYSEHGVVSERIKVLPFLPAAYLPSEVSDAEKARIRQKYRLAERFLFYPAQFWPHKNHGRIVRALGLLRSEQRIDATIVFCGSKEGPLRKETFSEAMRVARECGIESQIVNLGYVPDEDIGALYSEAAALVMPTFFGPTNIPVLEAWRFGCPVITSDIRGIREQTGDAAVLVDPRSAESIAEGIRKVWTDAGFCRALAARGRERLGTYTPADFQKRLMAIVEEAKAYGSR